MVKKFLSALLALFILSLFPLTVLAGDLPTSTNTINWSTVEVFAYGSGTYKKSLGKVQEAGGQGAFGKEFTPSDGMGIQGFVLVLPALLFQQLASGRLRFPSRQVALHYCLIGCMPVAVLKDLTLRIYPASFRRLLRILFPLTSIRLHIT